jgi:hypothetical protein
MPIRTLGFRVLYFTLIEGLESRSTSLFFVPAIALVEKTLLDRTASPA